MPIYILYLINRKLEKKILKNKYAYNDFRIKEYILSGF